MNTTAIFESTVVRDDAPPVWFGGRATNPWVSDHVLLSLSVWWVRTTHPAAADFSSEVAVVFNGLQRDLQ